MPFCATKVVNVMRPIVETAVEGTKGSSKPHLGDNGRRQSGESGAVGGKDGQVGEPEHLHHATQAADGGARLKASVRPEHAQERDPNPGPPDPWHRKTGHSGLGPLEKSTGSLERQHRCSNVAERRKGASTIHLGISNPF